jgi:hypothetical protein
MVLVSKSRLVTFADVDINVLGTSQVLAHNAWDNVALDQEQIQQANAAVARQAENPVESAFGSRVREEVRQRIGTCLHVSALEPACTSAHWNMLALFLRSLCLAFKQATHWACTFAAQLTKLTL